MKLSLIISLLVMLNLSASVYSQNTSFTLSLKDQTVKEILNNIENRSEFRFFYNDKFVDMNRKTSVVVENKNITDILNQLFSSTSITYQVLENNLIVITPRELVSQGITVTGSIVDASGEPMPGVNVLVKGTTTGVVTNIDGFFTINVPDEQAILLFSFIGYVSQEIPISGQRKINLTMEEDLHQIEEVVVIGYGTQRKKDLTSSVTSVKSDAFNKGAVGMNPLQMVEGKIAGLTITRTNGNDPNAGLNIQLRGVSSVKGDQAPLIVIDGVPGGDLTTVSQNDIASIDVLKDGSAAAIYGTRGTNGVILVTTKKGQTGSAKIDFEGYLFTETVDNRIESMSAEQYRKYSVDNNIQIVDGGASTDWFNELIKTPINQVYNLSLSGGSEKFTYRASASYRNQNGIVSVPTTKETINGRIALTQKAWDDKLRFDLNLAYTNMDSRLTDYASFEQAVKRNPTEPIFNSDGTYFYPVGSYEFDFNPVARLANVDNGLESNRFMGDFRMSLDIIPGLKASAMVAMRKEMNLTHYYDSRTSEYSQKSGVQGQAERKTTNFSDRTLEVMADYFKQIGKHRFSLMAGYSYQDFMNEEYRAKNMGFITDAFQWNNLDAGSYLKAGNAEMASSKGSNKLIAFLGRATYNYDERYLLTATMRREGSSRFGDNYKWGNFPAVSIGWRISNESFMQGIDWLSDLKFRFGYGVTGNQMSSNYLSIARMSGQQRIWQGDKYVLSYGLSSNPNPNLKWELKKETNFGMDFSAFDSRVGMVVDVYQRKNSDLLYEVQASVPSLLYPTIWANVGDMKSDGVEIVVYGDPIRSKDIVWTVSMNLAYNKSRLLSLSNDQYVSAAYFLEFGNLPAPGNLGNAIRVEENEEVGNFYGYRFLGFTSEGKWIFDDKNPDGKYDDNDKQIIGNGVPKWFAGLTTNFNYKRWELSLSFKGAFNFDILNAKEIYYANKTMFPSNNLMLSTFERHNELNDIPQYSSYYLEKGDYVKLSNLTLSYNFNTESIKRYISNLRVYFSADNLLTFTGYTGIDPELASNGFTTGIDSRSFYPRTRMFTFGVNLGF